VAEYEYREFQPWHHSRQVFDGEDAPAWLKKLSKRKKNLIHDRFAKTLAFAMECYLDNVAGNLPVKRKTEGKITEHDIKVQIAQIRRELVRMKRYVFGHKPMAFTRSNPYYRKGDEKAPFYSEAFLYPLLGKDDGRTVCYAFERLCELVGLERA
jgi:hypothetical protein